jgi:hypothetical protein
MRISEHLRDRIAQCVELANERSAFYQKPDQIAETWDENDVVSVALIHYLEELKKSKELRALLKVEKAGVAS